MALVRFRVKYPGGVTVDRVREEPHEMLPGSTPMSERGEPRWLTAEQQRAWVALVGVVIRLPAALDAQLQRDAGITHTEYSVLSWLSRQPGRTSRMSEIAALNSVTLSHLSRIAARLEQRGWLRRAPDPGDGRATLATLTETGWDKVVATAPGHVEEVRRRVFDQLQPAQVRHLLETNTSILDALAPGQQLIPPPVEA